jgi:hypothetical protein
MEAELDRIVSIFHHLPLPDKRLVFQVYRSADFRAWTFRAELHVVCGLLEV